MIARVNMIVHARHPSFLIDQHADPIGITGLWVLASTIGERYGSIGIAQERETQAETLCECRASLDLVETRADQDNIVLIKEWTMFLEAFCFSCAAWRAGLRKKPE